MIVLLTALPRVGKTTALERFIERWQSDIFWILSKELRDQAGERVGFEGITSDGRREIFAHKTLIHSLFMVGDYRVDVGVVDRIFVGRYSLCAKSSKKTFCVG